MTITETCSCSASITVTGGEWRSGNDARNPRGAEEVVERWRTSHRHEFTPAELMEPEEPPLIHESGSSHELSGVPYDEGRPPVTIGFQRSEVR